MNVHLTPELKAMVESEVASGRYASASEVIREGLRLFAEERQWRHQAGQLLADGLAEAKADQVVDGASVMSRLRRRIATERS